MIKIFNLFLRTALIFILFTTFSYKVLGEEIDSLLEQFKILQQDIKTLEKAVYSQDDKINLNSENLSSDNNDILTKHLLKLSELE